MLFGLFLIGGVVSFAEVLPKTSCAGVTPTHYAGDSVKIAGPGWTDIPASDCVEVISAQNAAANGLTAGSGFDLGPEPVEYGGDYWNSVRGAIGAWILWTAGMVFLAAAVAAVPKGRREPTTSPIAPGWYSDIPGGSTLRWWDGNGWTTHIDVGQPNPRTTRPEDQPPS